MYPITIIADQFGLAKAVTSGNEWNSSWKIIPL